MSFDPSKNFGVVSLSTGYASGVTSVILVGGEGEKLPLPSSDGEFNLVWYNATDYSTPSDDPNVEIIRCTARTTDTLTVIRAQEGTSDVNHNMSAKVYKFILALTKKTYDDIVLALGSHIDAVSGIHGITGTIVGTDDAQALLNKMITGADTIRGQYRDVTIFPYPFSAVSYFNGGSYTDLTEEAATISGTPFTVLEDTSDIFYVGIDNLNYWFGEVYFALDTVGVGITLVVEYFNESDAWSELFLISDGTLNLTQSGKLFYNNPPDWKPVSINGFFGYFIRLRTTTNSSQIPKAKVASPYETVFGVQPQVGDGLEYPLEVKADGKVIIKTVLTDKINEVTIADLKDAVTKKHSPGTDTGLDTGGSNPITAAQIVAPKYLVGDIVALGGLVNEVNTKNINPKNLITNGSFSVWNNGVNSAPDGFTAWSASVILQETNTSPILAPYQCKITATSPWDGIAIVGGVGNYLKVKPSTAYILYFYYKVTAGDTFAINIRSFNGAVGGTQHATDEEKTDSTWTLYSKTFTTDADATNLQVVFYAKADTDIIILSGVTLIEGSVPFAFSDPCLSRGGTIVAEIDETKFSHKLPIMIDGTLYYIMLTQS